MHNAIFVTCPKSFEDLLQSEMQALGIEQLKLSPAGVYGLADLRQAYQLCLWSRLANRVLWQLAPESGVIDSDYELYSHAYEIAWEQHIEPSSTIAVDFIGTNDCVKNTQFGAMRIKDALVDRLKERTGFRPNVDKTAPDIRINAHLSKDKLSISLDISGESLHRRGYRRAQGSAPVKENVAAGLLIRAGWPDLAKQNLPLIDPMCGSGTFLCEAGLIACDQAPGLYRRSFGFEQWLMHDAELWQELKVQAQQRAEKGRENFSGKLIGFDSDPEVLRYAQGSINNAKLASLAEVEQESLENFTNPCTQAGLLMINPPYGERLGNVDHLVPLYQSIGQRLKQECPNWRLGVLSSSPELLGELRLRAKRKNRFFNGALASQFNTYELVDASKAKLRDDKALPETLSEGAQMVANRLKKNHQRLSKAIAKLGTEAFRVYDADMPEYAAAVDLYAGQVHVQEYAAPKNIDQNSAQRRIRELIQACSLTFQVPVNEISLKVRKQNKGKDQYEKQEKQKHERFKVSEGKAQYWVNLWDYLDTGLFLDHRPLRRIIAQQAANKDFLNLFAYTASASVQAALGGAKSTVSVDMSKTYLDWARDNFRLNHLNLGRNELVQEDCFSWLKNCRKGFDLIMLDPPTFSNSKRMEGVLDVQRDHVALISRCMEILKPGGRLYFSNNLRNFKLDEELLLKFKIENITEQTLDVDFQRNKKIHHCFVIENI